MNDADKLKLAKKLVTHLCTQIRTRPEAQDAFGVCTESFDLITATAAALYDEPVAKVRDHILPGSAQLHRTQPEEILAEL